VEAIDRTHDTESVALLSPAAASLDQFRNYAQRGDRFKELVRNI
jgi:UDP-N-acetylmuramoylalanine--D-glutamate ligase